MFFLIICFIFGIFPHFSSIIQMSVAWVLVEMHGALKPAINYTFVFGVVFYW